MCYTKLPVPSLGDESLLYEALCVCVLWLEISHQGRHHSTSNIKTQRQTKTGMRVYWSSVLNKPSGLHLILKFNNCYTTLGHMFLQQKIVFPVKCPQSGTKNNENPCARFLFSDIFMYTINFVINFQVIIDATQESTLVQNFKALFGLEIKEIHPEDIRRESLEGLVFPEAIDPRIDRNSLDGPTNGQYDEAGNYNHFVKSERLPHEKVGDQGIVMTREMLENIERGNIHLLPPQLQQHYIGMNQKEQQPDIQGGKTPDYLKKHHKKSMIEAMNTNNNGEQIYRQQEEPMSKDQLHAMAVAQAKEIEKSMALAQKLSNKPPTIAETLGMMASMVSSGPTALGTGTPTTANSSNVLPSIRDLVQMPKGQVLAMASGLTSSQPLTNTTESAPKVTQPSPKQTYELYIKKQPGSSPESIPKIDELLKDPVFLQQALTRGLLPSGGINPPQKQEDRPALPAGVVVPRLPYKQERVAKRRSTGSESEMYQSEVEAHQAAAQLVSMANSRQGVSPRLPPSSQAQPRPAAVDAADKQLAAMVSNVAAGAEQQRAALSIEHEVAAQLEDMAKRKVGPMSMTPPVSSGPTLPPPLQSQGVFTPQKELTIDEQVAAQLEEFRRRKAIIEANAALKQPKKSPKARPAAVSKPHLPLTKPGPLHMHPGAIPRQTVPTSVQGVPAPLPQGAVVMQTMSSQVHPVAGQIQVPPPQAKPVSAPVQTTTAIPVPKVPQRSTSLDEQIAIQLREMAHRKAVESQQPAPTEGAKPAQVHVQAPVQHVQAPAQGHVQAPAQMVTRVTLPLQSRGASLPTPVVTTSVPAPSLPPQQVSYVIIRNS